MITDHACIQFLYEPLGDCESIGDVTFFNDGRIPGVLALGNETFAWNEAFDHSFNGHRACSPGQCDTQNIRVDLRGTRVQYLYDHRFELLRDVFEDRPVIEIECPSGEVLLFSYRAANVLRSQWCRVRPTLLDQPKPFGLLLRHVERVSHFATMVFWFAMIDFVLLVLVVHAAFYCAGIPI